MIHNFKYFPQIQNYDDLTAARFIDTAVTRLEDFKPCQENIAMLGDARKPLRVLDFGCGLGRNLVGIVEHSNKWQVWGYDHPTMLERAKKFYEKRLTANNQIVLCDDWENAVLPLGREKPFDFIFTSLVLQHIDLPELKQYLKDFTMITEKLYVLSRRALDDGWKESEFISIWPVVAEFFELADAQDGLKDGNSPHDHHYGIYKRKKHAAIV